MGMWLSVLPLIALSAIGVWLVFDAVARIHRNAETRDKLQSLSYEIALVGRDLENLKHQISTQSTDPVTLIDAMSAYSAQFAEALLPGTVTHDPAPRTTDTPDAWDGYDPDDLDDEFDPDPRFNFEEPFVDAPTAVPMELRTRGLPDDAQPPTVNPLARGITQPEEIDIDGWE